MKLNWHTEPSGLGWNYHFAEVGEATYLCVPEDLDCNHWLAFVRPTDVKSNVAGKRIGEGTWQSCRKLCLDHFHLQAGKELAALFGAAS